MQNLLFNIFKYTHIELKTFLKFERWKTTLVEENFNSSMISIKFRSSPVNTKFLFKLLNLTGPQHASKFEPELVVLLSGLIINIMYLNLNHNDSKFNTIHF